METRAHVGVARPFARPVLRTRFRTPEALVNARPSRPSLLAAVAALAVTATPAALAMSPWEAAEHAMNLGRPVTSYVNVPDMQITRHEVIFGGPAGSPLPIYLNRFGGS